MKKEKIILTAIVCMVLCTGCGNIPEPDPSVEEIPEFTSAETDSETEAKASTSAPAKEKPSAPETTEDEDKETESTEKSTKSTKASASKNFDEDEGEEIDEEETTEAVHHPWQNAYQKVLEQRYRKSEHEDSYFALIQLDDDDIPELVILDSIEMELYCYQDKTAQLLLEDAYKSNAIEEQNVCYQPQKGLFATAFSSMGGGSGFTIFSYPELNAANAERYYFDNNENVDGEMPYNHIWDRAEEFEVTDNGYHDVTLGESWVHIGEKFADIYELTEENAERVGEDWKPSAKKDNEKNDENEDENEEEPDEED